MCTAYPPLESASHLCLLGMEELQLTCVIEDLGEAEVLRTAISLLLVSFPDTGADPFDAWEAALVESHCFCVDGSVAPELAGVQHWVLEVQYHPLLCTDQMFQ